MSGRLPRRGAVVVLSTVLLGAALVAQEPPTFRGGTTLVEVSAIVTRDGVPVTDLRADEVRVLDEGVPQPLAAFAYVDLTTAEGSAQQRDFVLVIDDLHIAPRHTQAARRVAAQLIEALAPNDRLAIVNTGPHERVHQLTTDREPSRALLRRVHGQQGRGAGLPGEAEARARIALTVLRNVADVLAKEGAAGRRAVVVVSEGHPGFGEGVHVSRESLEAQLVREEYRQVLEAAAFANVSVYGIDPRGLTADIPVIGTGGNRDAAVVAGQAAQVSAGAMLGRYFGTLGLLSTSTGGLLTVDTNDLGRNIPQMLRDSRQYYRLAYVQPDPPPGKTHPATRRITVEVDRKGVDVRARQVYAPR